MTLGPAGGGRMIALKVGSGWRFVARGPDWGWKMTQFVKGGRIEREAGRRLEGIDHCMVERYVADDRVEQSLDGGTLATLLLGGSDRNRRHSQLRKPAKRAHSHDG